MLFATDEPVKGGPPADSGWELLSENVESLLPNAGALRDAELFAAEILGEETPVPAQRAQPQPATEPAAPPRESRKPTPTEKKPIQTEKKPTQAQKQVTPAPRAAAAPPPAARTLPAAAAPRVAVRTLPAAAAPAPTEARAKTSLDPIMPTRPPRRQRSGASKHAPSIVFGVGATVAAWLALMRHNYVLAAIAGTATLVGVVFAWLWHRR
ncbi:MAG TPA: hypothetical protein VFD82_14705 [Planctomycetota bacterium]|nr:hypothetical protein [Planctomycetota bacterium]